MTPIFELKIKVRDYECDIQGIVNNANYQHYTEHTRNEFIRSRGLAFDELHRRGIDTVVARLEMQFKTPLRPGDEFLSQLSVRREGIKYVFEQQLLRLPDHQLCLKAQTTVVAIVNGRLGDCEELQQLVP